MTQSMVTIISPIPLAQVLEVRQRLGKDLGNPAKAHICKQVMGPKGAAFLHFASLHAIAGCDDASGYLVLEFTADGSEQAAIALLAERIGKRLEPYFRQSSDWQSDDTLQSHWRRRQVRIGTGLLDNAGLPFRGTPEQPVTDIHKEDALARRIADLLSRQSSGLSPLERLDDVRSTIAGDAAHRWSLDTPPPPISVPRSEPTLSDQIRALALPFVVRFLWPLLLLVVPLAAWLAWPTQWRWTVPAILAFVLGWIGYILIGTLLPIGLAYFSFRRGEARDWVADRAPRGAELEAMFDRENAAGHEQNHMLSQTVLKPGLIRKLTMRLAFFAVERLTALNPRAGHLGDIGTIHFARWLIIPGTRDLLFFSNYGGSWESYLEDFITKAHAGLTAVWSNTVGFPRTTNLFQGGASDGERFKRFARESMIHTPFWYCAYPRLTTANIRTNRFVRRGMAGVMTEDEAVRWLALFGSAPRPAEKLETTQIQSLIFGGLGFKPHGKLLTIELGNQVDQARKWLAAVLPNISFNDGRYIKADAVLTFGASAAGLHKLGLPQSGLETFPGAFLAGMTGAGRDRILGDVGANAASEWSWGTGDDDVVLLVYGNDAASVDELIRKVGQLCRTSGSRIRKKIALAIVAKSQAHRIEPFGFVDGVSQPAIRGTYRGLRNDDPIHLVEPGEFIIGYPDNRGNVPPGPLLEARHDPLHHLPIAGNDHGFATVTADNPRKIGQNGTFLVIRQLAQNVSGFTSFCEQEAERLCAHFANLPVECSSEFIGAKMIGRWKDGTSLVRNPYLSASRLKQLTGHDPAAATARPEAAPTDKAATPIPAAEPAQTITQPAGNRELSEKAPWIRPDNDFLFGTEDPQGLRCPYGAHIRRANPRDSLSPGSNEQIAIANRHRIIRVGRGYATDQEEGLMFMCLNGDIERQFEFIQQTWMGSTKFHGLDVESDPIVTRGTEGSSGFTIPTRDGPIAMNLLPQFVTMRGGGYFFVPGRQLLRYLSDDAG